jgi:RNA polymerase sigma-70 factor, ECF subfamily
MSEEATKPSVDADLPLVRRARDGDYAAFETLVTRYEGKIYALAKRIVREEHDAEEVVQETFLSVLEHLAVFREDASFRTWLLRIATNAALKLLRKKRGLPMVSLEGSGGQEDEAPLPHPEFIAPWQESPADLAGRQEIRAILDEALGTLDEKHRVVFVLRDVEELSTEETAEVLGISVANVKVRLMRARLMLRERLTRVLGDKDQQAPSHRHDEIE